MYQQVEENIEDPKVREIQQAIRLYNDTLYCRTFVQGRLTVRTSYEMEARMRMKEQHPDLYNPNEPVIELKPNSVRVS
jgi:hypothetical protein